MSLLTRLARHLSDLPVLDLGAAGVAIVVRDEQFSQANGIGAEDD